MSLSSYGRLSRRTAFRYPDPCGSVREPREHFKNHVPERRDRFPLESSFRGSENAPPNLMQNTT